MKTHDFLLEVGTEEIPHWMIPGALADLQRLFVAAFPGVALETHSTPRRLVLVARQLPEKQPDIKEVVTGPPVKAGENAAQGFARKMGVEVAKLKTVSTPKGDYYSCTRKVKGRRTRDRLAEALPGIILGLSWPKTMTWRPSGERFIRPIRWLIAVLGGRVVPLEIAGVRSGNVSCAHRRLGPARLRVSSFEQLRDMLATGFVILDAAQRRRRIEELIPPLLGEGLRLRPNPELLDTLVHITEYPTPILGSFDAQFLSLPEEVLVTVMQHHQRYFSVEDAQGKLAPHFVAVMNIASDDEGIVRHGHGRVLRARFSDARFFWETDQKRPLAARLDDLKNVTFHAKLGSYYDKTQRNIERVKQLGGDSNAIRATQLAKCDLTTELVKELTELQGVVGGLYARAQGEPEEVAAAIYDQYEPVPRTRAGQILALADRLDTLESFSRIGLMPTGSRDPLALRRAALGVVRILVEGRHALPLPADPRDFLLDRVRYYFREVRGYRYDEVNAVLAARCDSLPDVADRLEALRLVRQRAAFEPLAGNFKRIRNILRQANWNSDTPPDAALLEPGPERDLYDEAEAIRHQLKNMPYDLALLSIAALRPRVDLFFDKVLVMAPDERVRNNRLSFLSQLLREFSTIADFSEIVISGDQPQ